MKTALITGVGGQDGRYLAEHLLANGYAVVGTSRRPNAMDRGLTLPIEVVEWDLKDEARLGDLIRGVKPNEIYNLAACSSGAGMFEDAVDIGNVNGLSVARILEAIRTIDPTIRFCQASSSELFGAEPAESPQSETTRFLPRSPYGAAKLYAHTMVGVYRRHYGLFACSAILFNHESPYRGDQFVTRTITEAAARISLGISREVVLGNLDAQRDWGFAGDYVQALGLMLQAKVADDYVVATGCVHSVREFCGAAFECVGLDYRDYVREDRAAFRPSEARPLVGDPSKARENLGWTPTVTFRELVKMMVEADLARLARPASEKGQDV